MKSASNKICSTKRWLKLFKTQEKKKDDYSESQIKGKLTNGVPKSDQHMKKSKCIMKRYPVLASCRLDKTKVLNWLLLQKLKGAIKTLIE